MVKPIMTQCCCCGGELRIGTFAILIIHSGLFVVTTLSELTLNYGEKIGMTKHIPGKTLRIINITFFALLILFNIIGLYGWYKKSHKLILPWVLYNGIFCISQMVFDLVMAILIGTTDGGEKGFTFFIGNFIIFGVLVYMWCVVYSYYAVLQEKNREV